LLGRQALTKIGDWVSGDPDAGGAPGDTAWGRGKEPVVMMGVVGAQAVAAYFNVGESFSSL
jgi:hypothetical protein